MPNNIKKTWSGYHADKDNLRADIWSLLKQQGVAIGDPQGHIPNFVGSQKAAEQLADLPIWQQSKAIKCNPDSPQIPVRSRALKDGKRLYMAVPRLTNTRCFVELTAEDLQQRNIPLEEAALAKAKDESGDPVDNVVIANVRYQIEKLKQNSTILSERLLDEKLKIVGGRYDLDTGKVTLI